MDDIALAGQYRTHLRRPAFLVPSDTLKRWRSLPSLNIMRKKMAELDGGAVGEKILRVEMSESCGLKCQNSAERNVKILRNGVDKSCGVV